MTAATEELTRRQRITAQIKEARAERDLVFRILDLQSEMRGAHDKHLADQAIRAFARAGIPFSANDVREELPDDFPTQYMGSRFAAAATAGLIRRVGLTTSTKKNTHAKDVAMWISTAVPEGSEPA